MHKRIHSGENPHQCHLCLKAFSERSKLRIICKHIKKKNLILAINDKKTFLTEVIWRSTSEQIQVKKAYSCNQCPTAFSQGGFLKRHMRIHSDEKPYPCILCPKDFSEGGTLTNIREHTQVWNSFHVIYVKKPFHKMVVWRNTWNNISNITNKI